MRRWPCYLVSLRTVFDCLTLSDNGFLAGEAILTRYGNCHTEYSIFLDRAVVAYVVFWLIWVVLIPSDLLRAATLPSAGRPVAIFWFAAAGRTTRVREARHPNT
jgi:hypothetical protein